MTEKMKARVPQADWSIKLEPTMDVSHVGDVVESMTSLLRSANVQFISSMKTVIPYEGIGKRWCLTN